MSDKIKNLPIWKEKYEKLGVTPRELHMRQNGLCWLKQACGGDGKVTIFCTDGTDTAVTANMLNPTIECVRCMVGFMTNIVEYKIEKK